jgi:hypothetical protein
VLACGEEGAESVAVRKGHRHVDGLPHEQTEGIDVGGRVVLPKDDLRTAVASPDASACAWAHALLVVVVVVVLLLLLLRPVCKRCVRGVQACARRREVRTSGAM